MSPRLRSRSQEIHPDYTVYTGQSTRYAGPGTARNGADSDGPRRGRTEFDPERRKSTEISRATCECIELLAEGRALIEALADEDYAFACKDSAWSSPGTHTRHFLDFVDCLLTGIDAQQIDYTARKRRGDVEASRVVGCRQIEHAIEGLEDIQHLDGRLPLEVRPETDQDWTRSTLSRELQFVSGHIVHHHALIRMTLAHRDIEAPLEYGVAQSTRAHRNAERETSRDSD